MGKNCKKWAIFDSSVEFEDRFKVPNFGRIGKFRKKSKAKKFARNGEKVYCVDR